MPFTVDQMNKMFGKPADAMQPMGGSQKRPTDAEIGKIFGVSSKTSIVPQQSQMQSTQAPRSNSGGNDTMNFLFGNPLQQALANKANQNLQPGQQPIQISNPVSALGEAAKNVGSFALDTMNPENAPVTQFAKSKGVATPVADAGSQFFQGASKMVGGAAGDQVIPTINQAPQKIKKAVKAQMDAGKNATSLQDYLLKSDLAKNQQIEDTLGTILAPANVLPETVKQGVAAPFEELKKETTSAIQKFGIDPNSERGQDIIRTINNLAQVGTLKMGEKAAPEILEGTKNLVGDVAKKGMESANELGNVIGGARKNRVINSRVSELTKLQENNVTIRKVIASAEKNGIDLKKEIAQTDLLKNAVDSDGTIRTESAIDKINEFIRPQEDVIGTNLRKEGKTISLSDIKTRLKADVKASGVKGGALIRALKNVESDIKGYKLEADPNGNIPVATLHDAKVDKYANVDYLNPESSRIDKVIAKSLKQLVEENASSIDVKGLNSELSKYYSMQNFLEKLNGKKVAGGRLGKYFAQGVGGMAGHAIGSGLGPLGQWVGVSLGSKAGEFIKGRQMMSTFKGKTGFELKPSEAMQKAMNN